MQKYNDVSTKHFTALLSAITLFVFLPVFLVFAGCAPTAVNLKTPDISQLPKYKESGQIGVQPSSSVTRSCKLRMTFQTVSVLAIYEHPNCTYMLKPVLKSAWEQVMYDLWQPAGSDVINSFECKVLVHASKLSLRGKKCTYEVTLFASLYAPDGKQLMGRTISQISQSKYDGQHLPDSVITACYQTAYQFAEQMLNTPAVLHMAKKSRTLEVTPPQDVKPRPMQVVQQKKTPDAPTPVAYRAGAQNRFAVVIGISKYKYGNETEMPDLLFADTDAHDVAGALKKMGWRDSHVKLLVNEQASERQIRIALESWLTKARPSDLIFLYWSGHGFPDPEDPEKVYFACYDTDHRIPATGYRMDRVRTSLEEKGVRNVVLIADTCHAGKLITRGEGEKGISVKPYIEKIKREASVPKGWIFMVSADSDRKAIEHTSWSNGAFTHCFLKALDGAADGYESVGPKDGIVTMGELRSYINSAMPDETQKILGTAKHPIITTSTGDPDIWELTIQAK